MSEKRTVVVLGMMGRAPFAGVAWQGLHYLEGFRRLGHEVFYVEDTGDWPYDPESNRVSQDASYTLKYLARILNWCGLSGAWAYRSAADAGRVFGMTDSGLADLLGRADVLVNLTGATVLRDEHLRVPVRIYLETDPVLPQIEVAQGNRFTTDLLAAHTHHFTFGENIGTAGCGIPADTFRYMPTRQPIVLEWWAPNDRPANSRPFTTIASWQQAGKDVEWAGERYTWSKHHEFLKFVDLPQMTSHPLELALAPGGAESNATFAEATALLSSRGWGIADALALSRDVHPYREYIVGSYGEFTVAKDQNIRLQSGWFSDRSACYLAAGRPVITQDTGFDRVLPAGEGLFAFTTMDEVVEAIAAIESDYERHSRVAHEIAAEYFSAEKVVAGLLERAGLS